MSPEDSEVTHRSIDLTTEIVSAYVSHNPVPLAELVSLIERVHTVVSETLDATAADGAAQSQGKAKPAQIRQSVMPDALISFIDGKPYKTLKRHLASHGLDPSSYRERYGLPSDYPMVAQGYAEQRSQIAKAIGLGATGSRSNQRRMTA